MTSVANRLAANDPDSAAARGLQARFDFLRTGNPGPVLEAVVRAIHDDAGGTLAMVLETEGSTYADPGAMAVFADETQTGWLSGGCLEPELARRAALANAGGRVEWLEIDTRDDAALFSGAALGCRGRLRVALLPLRLMPGAVALFDAWLQGGARLDHRLDVHGHLMLAVDGRSERWHVPTAAPDWHEGRSDWSLLLPRPPEACLLGAGPETPILLRMLGELGWRSTLCDRRPRWAGAGLAADCRRDAPAAEHLDSRPLCDAALVMHHDFELDRDALEALAKGEVPFVGLLGPPRRRDDLLKLLPPASRDALRPRLHAPVGMDLGGKGPEAIALSIAAQLQAWRNAAGAA